MSNQVLEELGFSQTVDKLEFSEKSVQFWVGEGAHQEDRPIYAIGRVRNHFHNPLQRWDIAGLENGNMGYSSIVWSQLPPPQTNVFDGGSHSWAEARLAYREALTKSLTADRDQSFSNTFLTLGHLVHLVQDAASPAHTRDDLHIVGVPWSEDGYEVYVRKFQTNAATDQDFDKLIAASDRIDPDPALLTSLTGYPQEAPLPIARLIDSDTYTGALVPSLLTGINIGLAEYTNANFVSDDTIFANFFPLPRIEGLGAGTFEPEDGGYRRYFPKLATHAHGSLKLKATSKNYEIETFQRLSENGLPSPETSSHK